MTTRASTTGTPGPAALEVVGDVVLRVLARIQEKDAESDEMSPKPFFPTDSVPRGEVTNGIDHLPSIRSAPEPRTGL